MCIIYNKTIVKGEGAASVTPEGILSPPYCPKHFCSIPPSVLQWRFFGGGTHCCIPGAGIAQCPRQGWVLPDQAHRTFPRQKGQSDLQGGIPGTLQMLSFRCHGPRLSGGRRNMQRCVGVRACSVPHQHLPRLPPQNWAPIGTLSIGPEEA